MATESTHQHPVPEAVDIHPYKVMLVGAALTACVLLVTFIVSQLVAYFHGRIKDTVTVQPDRPHLLLSDPTHERAMFDAEMQQRLHGYSIDNANPRYAHIPIERAMQLMTQKEQIHDAQ